MEFLKIPRFDVFENGGEAEIVRPSTEDNRRVAIRRIDDDTFELYQEVPGDTKQEEILHRGGLKECIEAAQDNDSGFHCF